MRPVSGRPSRLAETANPLIKALLNPACSHSFAERPSWQPGIASNSGCSSSRRSRVAADSENAGVGADIGNYFTQC